MNTEEVDLHHLLLLVIHTNRLEAINYSNEIINLFTWGTAEMKAKSFLFVFARTPQCHVLSHPGMSRALIDTSLCPFPFTFSPLEELLGIIESEHVIVIFDVVLTQKSVYFLQLLLVLKGERD